MALTHQFRLTKYDPALRDATGAFTGDDWILFRQIGDTHRLGSRPWLFLLGDEVEPRVLDAVEPKLVVWSSIWPNTPDEVIRLELAPDGLSGTNLTWTLTSPAELPPKVVGHQRFRLNKLLWADLRYSYGQ